MDVVGVIGGVKCYKEVCEYCESESCGECVLVGL